MLAVPRRSVSIHAVPVDPQQRLVIVDHHRPRAEVLAPQPCMRGLADAAFRRKRERLAVHRDHRSVHQQHVLPRQPFGDLPVQRQLLKVRIPPCGRRSSFPQGGRGVLLPLKREVLWLHRNAPARFCIGQIVLAKAFRFREHGRHADWNVRKADRERNILAHALSFSSPRSRINCIRSFPCCTSCFKCSTRPDFRPCLP